MSRAISPVLVTGGAGYIGSHLVRKLLDRGKEVIVLDNLSYGDQGLQAVRKHPRLRFFQGDICDIKAVVKAVKGCRTVIALAAIVGDPACALNEDDTNSTNYEATKVLVEVALASGMERFIFASSCSVYGANSKLLLNEGSWVNPVSLYARTRVMSEKMILERSGSMTAVILRLATVFGWSERMRFDLVANILTAKAVTEGKIQIFGGEQLRPLIHVQDAADAFILAAKAPEGEVDREIFNVGGDDLNFTIYDIGKRVATCVPGTNIEVHPLEEDARDYRVSFGKIRHLLAFEPQFSLEDGVREVAHALQAGRIDNYTDEVYYNVRYLYK
ncbi:MAG: SDR family oxidoreductase [bacterium]|nr:SDR family oxidoreductase [bacterium]